MPNSAVIRLVALWALSHALPVTFSMRPISCSEQPAIRIANMMPELEMRRGMVVTPVTLRDQVYLVHRGNRWRNASQTPLLEGKGKLPGPQNQPRPIFRQDRKRRAIVAKDHRPVLPRAAPGACLWAADAFALRA